MKLLTIFILLNSPFLCGMRLFEVPAGHIEPTVQTIDDVPKFCTDIIEKLNEQPVIQSILYPRLSDSEILEDSHILNLPLVDCTIVDWVNDRARETMPLADSVGRQCWRISKFNSAYRFYLANGEITKEDGLRLSDANKDTRYSISELNEKYKNIIAAVRTGWRFSHEKSQTYDLNLPGAFERKDWHLLAKKKFLGNEDLFLRCFAAKAGMEHEMRCLTKYEWFDRRSKVDDELHLWIRPGSLEKVVKKLGIS